MTEKGNGDQCDLHSGVAQQVNDLSGTIDTQGKWVVWIAGIFVVVAIAITGFLWTRLEAVEKKIVEKIECNDRITTETIERFVKEIRFFREKQIEIDTRLGVVERRVK